jgi:hypothetical protein
MGLKKEDIVDRVGIFIVAGTCIYTGYKQETIEIEHAVDYLQRLCYVTGSSAMNAPKKGTPQFL